MFSGFFGKDDKADKADKTPVKDAPIPRGVEVVEDDPDTTWGLWESAVAEQDSRLADLPTLPEPTLPEIQSSAADGSAPESPTDFDTSTQPMPLEDMSPEQRRDKALGVVELHHHRIANTIRTMWGYPECGGYISKLIMNGGDGMGHARIGFNQDAAAAMMALAGLHDSQFGASQDDSPGGFGKRIGQANWNKLDSSGLR